MKKISIPSKSGLITLWVLCLLYQHAQSQTPNAYTGIWGGNFMEQFKTVILLDQADQSTYFGKIMMYSGENLIQDDELSNISIDSNKLSFYIAAKETSFTGTFNEMLTELSGKFIFPDNSKHPLLVNKYKEDSLAVNSIRDNPSLRERLNLDASMEELKFDFKDLVEKLKKHHPRLYAYTSEEVFSKQVQNIDSQLNQDMNPEQYYLRIAPLIASVKCSHTRIRLPGPYRFFLHEERHFFPLELFILDKKAYSLAPYGEANAGSGIDPGSEIISINNMPVKRIISELLSIIPSEGNNMTTKYQELNRDFQSYFHMLDPSESFLIAYDSSVAAETVRLKACVYKELQPRDRLELSSSIFIRSCITIMKITSAGQILVKRSAMVRNSAKT